MGEVGEAERCIGEVAGGYILGPGLGAAILHGGDPHLSHYQWHF